jgi:hypothetical protein
MRTPARIWSASAILLAAFSADTALQFASADEFASDVYIQQSRGRVSPGAQAQKPPPEATSNQVQSPTGPTAPVTCDAQNQSSQACYTATQQARPASR